MPWPAVSNELVTYSRSSVAVFAALLATIALLAAGAALSSSSIRCVVVLDCDAPAPPAPAPNIKRLEVPPQSYQAAPAAVPAWPSAAQPARLRLIQLADLAKAEATWGQMRPLAYELTVKIHCFCHLNESLIAHRVDGTQSVPIERGLLLMPTERDETFDTVDHIFAWLRKSLASKPYVLKVRFDQRLGYPINGQLDGDEMISDDYLFFQVVELTGIER